MVDLSTTVRGGKASSAELQWAVRLTIYAGVILPP